jgi:hypothetical protein
MGHYATFYVAAIVKPVCALFRLFLSLPLLSNDDWTQTRTYCRHAHTDNVDRWIGYAPHSPCGGLRLLGLAPFVSLLGSTCLVCCWLRDAWGLLAPNDLLSVSAARPPSPQSPMRFEALRAAQWGTAPPTTRFISRTRLNNEPLTPTHCQPCCPRMHQACDESIGATSTAADLRPY